jgi:radical SAM-linked protein
VIVGADTDVPIGRDAFTAEEKGAFKALRVSYSKRGQARYFGHLELVKIFIRAFRRARIPLRFSKGFHPAPKVSFEYALPVGIESLEEHFTIQVPLRVSRETIMECLNPQLPEGITVTACDAVDRSLSGGEPKLFQYTVTLTEGGFSEDKLKVFLEKTEWPFTRKNRKGRPRTIDLRRQVRHLKLLSPKKADMILELRTRDGARPTEVLGSVFGLSEQALKVARIIKGPVSASGQNSLS